MWLLNYVPSLWISLYSIIILPFQDRSDKIDLGNQNNICSLYANFTLFHYRNKNR